MRAFTPVLLFALLAVPRAFAAETMYQGDPNREVKEDIEDAYGIYILNPTRRHPKEKVEINRDSVELWLYHDPRKVDYDRIKCDAIKWLLTGRFGKGGAQNFFTRFPKFNSVELDMFQLNSVRTVDANGKYTVTRQPSTVLKVKLTRKKADRFRWEQVEETMKKLSAPGAEPDACVRTAERLIDAKYYNREYFR